MKTATVKLWLGGVGLVVGLAGMALQIDWVVWGAVGLLGVAFLLRFLKGGTPGPPAALVVAILLALVRPAAAQQPSPVRVARASDALRLDGVPDEPAWLTADSIGRRPDSWERC